MFKHGSRLVGNRREQLAKEELRVLHPGTIVFFESGLEELGLDLMPKTDFDVHIAKMTYDKEARLEFPQGGSRY